MDDRLLRYINGNEEIKKAMPVFKEAFIQFYGEEHREEIEKKFSNLLPIGYIAPKDIELCVSKLTKRKSEELILLSDKSIKNIKNNGAKISISIYFSLSLTIL